MKMSSFGWIIGYFVFMHPFVYALYSRSLIYGFISGIIGVGFAILIEVKNE
jgi:hypothetical protein